MRNYEMMTIIKPELTEDAVLAVADRVSKLIESQQGESITVNKWGRRKLAYPINKISEGFYILFNFAAEVKAKEEEFRHDIIEKLGLRSSESEYDGGNSSDYINDYKRNKLTNPKYCIVGDSSLFITYNGDILGCFQDFSGKCIVANIRNSNLKDIIKHKKDKVGRYEFCSNCNSNIAILNID